MSALPTAPAPLNRPKIALFIWQRGLDYHGFGKAVGRTREWARLVCLPFDDPRRRIPDEADLARIYAWTKGEVSPADFYPPALQALRETITSGAGEEVAP